MYLFFDVTHTQKELGRFNLNQLIFVEDNSIDSKNTLDKLLKFKGRIFEVYNLEESELTTYDVRNKYKVNIKQEHIYLDKYMVYNSYNVLSKNYNSIHEDDFASNEDDEMYKYITEFNSKPHRLIDSYIVWNTEENLIEKYVKVETKKTSHYVTDVINSKNLPKKKDPKFAYKLLFSGTLLEFQQELQEKKVNRAKRKFTAKRNQYYKGKNRKE